MKRGSLDRYRRLIVSSSDIRITGLLAGFATGSTLTSPIPPIWISDQISISASSLPENKVYGLEFVQTILSIYTP
jgi:hypothetical protein